MPDDERTRRRVSDETKERIADLSSGWSLDGPAPAKPTEPAAEPAPAEQAAETAAGEPEGAEPRKRPRTVPPPPPGSQARKALEQAIIEAVDTPVPTLTPPADAVAAPMPSGATRTKPTQPPPIPGRAKSPSAPPPAERAKSPSAPPPAERAKSVPPAAERAKSPSAPPPAERAKSVPPERSRLPSVPPAIPPIPPIPQPPERAKAPTAPPVAAAPSVETKELTVPVGEFDSAGLTLTDEQLKAKYAHETVVRDAADAVLKLPDQPLTVVKETPVEVLLHETAEKMRGDPTVSDPSTARFERGDPTSVGSDRGDATTIDPPSGGVRRAGVLRAGAALRRKRGLAGDMRYVFTALLGVRQARRELGELEGRQKTRQEARRRHLVTLGRTAISGDGVHHPSLGKSRDEMQAVEDDRSRHAGAVASADAELERLTRERDARAKQHIEAIAALDAELVDIDKTLEPLTKDAASVKRRASGLRDSMQRIEVQIAQTEASLVSVKSQKQERAAIEAEIASLKADRQAIQKDEPKIAAELDALDPRIASLEAARSEAQRKRAEAIESEAADIRRTADMRDAIGAKRKVVDSAAAEAATARDRVLFELGDRLYVDRPATLSALLGPIDTIDLELGDTDRRIMELREIISNVDRAKVARGASVIVLGLAAIGALALWFSLSLF